MKPPTRFLIGGAFVLALGLALILPLEFSRTRKAENTPAITNVLSERLKLRSQVTVNGQMYLQPYVAGLKKIDASNCPKDFRLAWIDYVNAWDRRTDQSIDEYGKDVVAFVTGFATQNFDHTLKRLESSDNAEAWRGVKKAALASGVAITD